MGHAYTIFPEILQVPLIVHLPSAWAGVRADTSAPAFTTDLTPTLYALLGHEPRPPAAFFGRPLFRRDGAPRALAIDGSASGRLDASAIRIRPGGELSRLTTRKPNQR